MKSLRIAVAALALAGWVRAAEDKERPNVEVAFVLDTTGSMGGLLEGAKQKIWSIANEIAKAKPTPRVKIGLVAYRDRGDKYVTQVFDLSDNLDRVYQDLLGFKADGGGDTPEHVLKGLEDGIEKLSWSREAKTLKVVYLVGDAPAHLEYGDTPPLETLTQNAVKKGLIVNTILCGGDLQASAQWQKIARLGEGKFFAIAQNGGVAAVTTPFDERLADLGRRLDGTMIAYGARKAEATDRIALASSVAAAAPASVAAERGMFKAKAGFDAEYDLAQAVADKKVDAAKLKPEERAKVEKTLAERRQLRRELDELGAKRAAYLKNAAPKGPRDSFDASVTRAIREQGALKGIRY